MIVIVICDLSYLEFVIQVLNSSFTKFDSGIHDLAVCKTLCKIETSALSITYTYWTLVDAWVKKDQHLVNQNCHFGSM